MNKLRMLFWIFALLIAAVVLKLFYIQIVADEKYSTTQYLRARKIAPMRGNIFDRNREPLTLNKVTYRLFAEPLKIEDTEEIIYKVDKLLKIGDATLEAKLDTSKHWMSLATGLSKEDKDAVAKLQLKGLGFDEEQRRFYPEASIAAHLLGFVGKDESGENVGYFGLEGFYEKDLAGLPGILRTERDLFGNPIFIGIQDKLHGEDGRNLVLTIDKTVQRIAKDRLDKGLERFGASEGCVIVANPQTMEILASVCMPDYDQEKYYEFSEEFFTNSAVSLVYEPGSIFKALIMAAALEEEAVKPNDTYDEDGPVEIGNYVIRTWDNKYHGEISMSQILQKSSNTGIVYVGEKLGKKKLVSYLEKFGFGEQTGIDLQGEATGVLKRESQWYPIDVATVAFGQGIAVTPIQMLRAFAAVINGGVLYRPYVVRELGLRDSDVREIKPLEVRRVISKKTSKIIRGMLEKTVEHGEAKWAVPKGYRIGGKTGTAQIPIEGHYDPSKTIASFIGFAPVDEPQFIVLVTLKEPETSPWGSETAAPLFFEIARELMIYYNIAPE